MIKRSYIKLTLNAVFYYPFNYIRDRLVLDLRDPLIEAVKTNEFKYS